MVFWRTIKSYFHSIGKIVVLQYALIIMIKLKFYSRSNIKQPLLIITIINAMENGILYFVRQLLAMLPTMISAKLDLFLYSSESLYFISSHMLYRAY